MKFVPVDNRRGIATTRAALTLALAVVVPFLLYRAAPSWWSSRGVLLGTAPLDDYAPANHGQLKNIAKAAAAEMDAKLPGGAGDAVHALIANWSTSNAQTNAFAPVNLGQLKKTAAPFYDRLIVAGLANQYPWGNPSNPPTTLQLRTWVR